MSSPSSSAQSLPDYAELFCLSNFTFLQGASHAEELVARAVQLGYSALALTDDCSLAGVVRAHAEAKKAALPLIGAHFHLTRRTGSHSLSLILLAQNRNGYGNLSELITLGRTRSEKGRYLRRRQGLEPVDYPSDDMKIALGRTLGVPIFQEQLRQVAILAWPFQTNRPLLLARAQRPRRASASVQTISLYTTQQQRHAPARKSLTFNDLLEGLVNFGEIAFTL